MPSRKHFPKREEDPFKRVRNWDDGYGYGSYVRHPPPVPSPSSEAREWKPRRRTEHSPTPPRRRDTYSPPPPAQRSRPRFETRASAPPPPRRTHTTSFSRPSPPPHHRDWDRARDQTRRRAHNPPSPSPPPPRQHQSLGRARARSRSRSRPRFRSRSLSRSRDRLDRTGKHTSPARAAKPAQETEHHYDHDHHHQPHRRLPERPGPRAAPSPRWQKALGAALQAGGLAALGARGQPGAWKGEKGVRVAGAALGAVLSSSAAAPSNSRPFFPFGGNDGGKNRSRSRDGRRRGRDGQGGKEASRERHRESRGERERGGGGSGSGRSGRRRELEELGDALGGFIAERLGRRGR